MAKKLDVYMPLMVGDWLKGTRGMRADVKGVYLGLLLHQWDHGFIPSDIYDLELIEPEVHKVWVSLKDKFKEVSPGKLQNEKLEEVRAFFQKQRKNGKSGGRPKNENPKQNPNGNPNTNPKPNLHNELDLEYESENDSDEGGGPGEVPRGTRENEWKTDETKVEEKLLQRLDELYLDQQRVKWPEIDFDAEVKSFFEKVRGSPSYYANHEDLRLAFQAQLRNAKKKSPNGTSKHDRSQQNFNDIAIILQHASGGGDPGN